MLYKIKKDTYIRTYGKYGYITSVGLYNDRVVDASGAVFLSVLSYTPQSLEELAEKIAKKFVNADKEQITEDARSFFNMLAEDGFLTVGETPDEILKNDVGFTYHAVEPVTIKKDFSSRTIRTVKDTQNTLDSYFLHDPKIITFQMELTNQCNERCVHCYIPHKDKVSMMKPDLFYKVLDQLSDLGVFQLTLSGGEPMLHPDFIDFVRAAKDKKMYVSVLSNLTLLNDSIISVLKETAVSSLQVSLYSMNPQHHDAITTVPGSFDKTISGILELIKNDIPVHISCPTMKENKDDFREVLEWAKEHKIRAFTDYSIMAEYDHNTANLSHRLSPEECGKVIADILQGDKEYQNEIMSKDFIRRTTEYKVEPDSPFCGVGISTCCMIASGSVYPCAGWQSYTCGDLNKQPLSEIWLHSPQLEYLRRLKRKDISKCLDCKDAAFCAPCLVRNANESPTGNMLEVNDYFCEVAAMNRKIAYDYIKDHIEKK